jgi:hypothetical protein
MDEFAKYIDVLIQAPLTVTLIWFIYKQSQMNNQTLEAFKKIIEKLIERK